MEEGRYWGRQRKKSDPKERVCAFKVIEKKEEETV